MPKGDKLSIKMQKFCNHYVVEGDATKAYKLAGYKASTNNIAGIEGNKLLKKPLVIAYIAELMDKLKDSTIMDATEVMQGLTAIARNEVKEQVVVTVGTGDGCSKAVIIEKDMPGKDRLTAYTTVGKKYGLFTDKLQMTGEMVVFNGEDKLED